MKITAIKATINVAADTLLIMLAVVPEQKLHTRDTKKDTTNTLNIVILL